MAEFKVKTKGNADPHGKARVYFCCHPEDFDRYFDKICEDVFRTHDCAICYTEDMNEPLDQINISEDLKRCHLFLVPVTKKLLTTPCRAMQVDLAYAKANDKSILPFMMEEGIGSLYELPENFDKLQYISPYSTDATAISYEMKLKKLLDEKLLNQEMIKRIKEEFDSYIFLSYRKKDRGYANELMKAMHSIPGCRDIAIWFDEFIVPGEDWLKNINHALDDVKQKSNLFTLLVTPHLFEYTEMDGKMVPNFVMREEYPAAKDRGMNILPTEMEKTSIDDLRSNFEGVPDPVNTGDEQFSETMVSIIKDIANDANNDDPKHNYLIGLAYINGIDVEVNVGLGLELITMAAEAEYEDALEKLYKMYSNGDNVKLNYEEALKWASRLVEVCKKKYGENGYDTLWRSINLAIADRDIGDTNRSLKICEQIYETLINQDYTNLRIAEVVLYDLAVVYREIKDYQKALELSKRAYDSFLARYGESNFYTLEALSEVALGYFNFGEIDKALETLENAYKLACNALGNKNKCTIEILAKQALIYSSLNKHEQSLEINLRVYDLQKNTIGEDHPRTILTLYNTAVDYYNIEYFSKALEICKKVYSLRHDVLSDYHPQTIDAIDFMADVCRRMEDYDKAVELWKKLYTLRLDTLEENHPDTLKALEELARTYLLLDNGEKGLELFTRLYDILCKKKGDTDPETLKAMNNIAFSYEAMFMYKEALETHQKVYELRRQALGEGDVATIRSLRNIALSYYRLDMDDKVIPIYEEAYRLAAKHLGKKHPDTIKALDEIIFHCPDEHKYLKLLYYSIIRRMSK